MDLGTLRETRLTQHTDQALWWLKLTIKGREKRLRFIIRKDVLSAQPLCAHMKKSLEILKFYSTHLAILKVSKQKIPKHLTAPIWNKLTKSVYHAPNKPSAAGLNKTQISKQIKIILWYFGMLSQGCGPAAKSAFDQMCTLVGYDHVWICAIHADKKMLSDKSDNFQIDLKTVLRCTIPSLS